jgi:transcriptional regulator with XRE-family HTH domain
MASFKEDFREFYRKRNINSDAELSKMIEVDPSYISKLINNPILSPRDEVLQKMAEAFAKNMNKEGLPFEKEVNKQAKDIQTFFEQARKNETKKRYKLSLFTELRAKDKFEVMKYVEDLEKKTGAKVKFITVEEGSIILTLESSADDFEKIYLLYKSGKLTHLLDVPIISIEASADLIAIDTTDEILHLTQWLCNIFDDGWQAVEELLNSQQLIPLTWSEQIKRAKLITELTQRIVLVITIRERETSPQFNIGIEVYPKDQQTLPKDLTLQMLTDEENISLQAIALENAPYIECRFNCDYEDKFIIKLIESGIEVREYFTI